MEQLKRIIIGGKNYPFKMDLNVLEIIQNTYGTINEFERELLGLKILRDESGHILYTDDGEKRMYRTEPSVKAIKAALPAMINEGLEIEADFKGCEYCPVYEKEIFRECTISFELLADMIYEEFKRCFATKK